MSDEDETRAESATGGASVPAGSGSQLRPHVPSGSPHSGAVIGRYVLLRQLERGGNRLVYLAYDPELDRKVALKLLTSTGSTLASGARRRLIGEAQALAKLSHPHIVQVYDVGTWKEQVYVAMEVVDAESLRDWTGSHRRPWREVVAAIADAGRGLAAAHAAGLLHLDLTPACIRMSSEGDVRVVDFAFAPPSGECTPSASLAAVGTLGYRAPETAGDTPVFEPAADQFSLAVIAWECLFGERPFAGATHDEVWAAASAGPPRKPLQASKVPLHVRKAIERALGVEPARRFPSMAEFVGALDQGGSIRRRRRGVGIVVATLSVATAATVLWMGKPAPEPCAEVAHEIDAVWSPTHAHGLVSQFEETGLPYADTVAATLVRALDRHAEHWSSARVQTCEATHVHAEQSTSMLERRTQCLEAQLADMGAVVERLEQADPAMVRLGLAALEGLAPASECDAARVIGRRPLPKDPATRRRVETLRKDLAHASALSRTGGVRQGLGEAQQVLGEATELGYLPLVASAAHLVGFLHTEMGRPNEAAESFDLALDAADASGMDVLRAETLLNLLWIAGHDRSNRARAEVYADNARAVIRRVGSPPQLRAHLATNLAVVHARDGDFDKAIAGCEEALAIHEAWPDDGSTHGGLASLLNNLGGFYYESGRLPEALAQYERAIELRSTELGPEHPLIASLLGNIGNVRQAMGEPARALEAQDRGVAILRRAVDPDSVDFAQALNNRAVTLSQLERLDEAAADYAQAIDIYEGVNAEDPRVAIAQMNYAELCILRGEYEEAMKRSAEAVELMEKVLGTEHPHLGYARLNRGWALLEAGRASEAVDHLRVAKTITETKLQDPKLVAQAEFLLGRALIETGEEDEGVALVDAARPVLEGDPAWRGRLDAWDARSP